MRRRNMKMRELCEKTGMSKRNVHFYIKEGLLEPVQDKVNGYFEFSQEDAGRLLMIRSLRNAGFSIPHIRSVLQMPATSVYYMNLRLKQVRREIAHLKELEKSVYYLQQNLPLHPSLADLGILIQNADIPPADGLSASDSSLEENDSALVNRYLWENFLPDGPLTNYQEYLWSRINRYMAGPFEADYRHISMTLHSLSEEQIRNAFSGNRQIHEEVIRLKEEDYVSYAEKMKAAIGKFLDHPKAVGRWKKQYTGLTAPAARLYDSDMGRTMAELSPLFASYRKNANAVCLMVYNFLNSSDGQTLKDLMKRQLGEYYDIEGCSHGQLQAMAYWNK